MLKQLKQELNVHAPDQQGMAEQALQGAECVSSGNKMKGKDHVARTMCDLQNSVPDKLAYLDETFTEVADDFEQQRLQDGEQGRRGQAAQVDFVEDPRTLSLLNSFMSAARIRAQHVHSRGDSVW